MRTPPRPFLLILVTLGCAAGASCMGGTSPAGSGGGAPVDAGDEEGNEADAPADEGDAPPDVQDAPEEPWGEAGWKPVAWNAPCAIEVAENPAAAVPPLIWDPCTEGEPGCEQARLDWDVPFAFPFGSLNVLPWGSGFRVGALLFYKGNEKRATIYDESGNPLVAWRASECTLTVPMLTPKRAWLGAQSDTSAWIVESYEKLAIATGTTSLKLPCQGYVANEDTLCIWGASGQTSTIYDRLSNSTKTLSPPPGIAVYQPYPIKDSALMRWFPEFNRAEGWIWNRDTNLAAPLIQSGGTISVVDIKSDGATLVWIEGGLPISQQGTYAWSNLWTSPLVVKKNDLVASKRRSLPELGAVSSYAGNGFYAVYGSVDKFVHVYRLSDAQHWSFKPPATSSDFHNVSYVDKDRVWYHTFKNVYRQSMATLGPGDPPP